VQQAALSSRLPFSLNFNLEQIWVPGFHQPGDRGTPTHNARVSSEYFETLGIPLVEGRLFTAADTPSTTPVLVINETMARRYWAKETAVGKRIRLRGESGPPFEIVGVVANHKVQTVGEADKPYMHFAYNQQPGLYQVIVVRSLAARALSGVLYGVSATDPIAWASASALLLTVAALANLLPASRASRIRPTEALRQY
jgi:hypothetical protein